MPDNLEHTIRLNVFLASRLAIGRRQADVLIAEKRVAINGTIAILGARINPAHDHIALDHKHIAQPAAPAFMYVLLNKPVGYICSRRQQGDAQTIYALLPHRYHHLKPVGRLDKDSSGLLLLTNDGQLAHQFTHPKFAKLKRYEVALDKPLQPLHHRLISDHGVRLPDGLSKLQLERLQDNDAHYWLVTMHEGRNRQIRRTFASLGYELVSLHRTQFGPLIPEMLIHRTYREVAKLRLSNLNSA